MSKNVLVQALRGFEHDGRRRRGDRFTVSVATAQRLEHANLASLVLPESTPKNPTAAAGVKSSASPVAPASRPKTANKRKHGETPPQEEASSSPTQPSEPAPGPTCSTPSTEPGGSLI